MAKSTFQSLERQVLKNGMLKTKGKQKVKKFNPVKVTKEFLAHMSGISFGNGEPVPQMALKYIAYWWIDEMVD